MVEAGKGWEVCGTSGSGFVSNVWPVPKQGVGDGGSGGGGDSGGGGVRFSW